MLIISALSAIFIVFIIPAQIPLKGSWGSDIFFTSRTYPYFASVSLLIVSALGCLWSARRMFRINKKMKEQGIVTAREKITRQKVLVWFIPYITYGFIVLYGVLVDRIGFIFATAIVPPVMLLALGCKKWTYYLSVYVFAAVLYLIFRVVFLVPLR